VFGHRENKGGRQCTETMQVPQDLPHDVLPRDHHVAVRPYPFLWTVVALSPFCALFWIAVIRGLIAVFSG